MSLDFSSGTVTVNGVGNLTIQTGAQLGLSGDTIASAVDLDNQGTLQVGAGTSTISSTSFTQAGDLVILSSGAGAATLTVANGFTNDGVITLEDNFGLATLLTVSSGTLVNAAGSTIFTSSGVGTRVITAHLDNRGLLDIDNATTINESATLTNLGSLDIDADLTINAAANFVSDSGTVDIAPGASLIVGAVETQLRGSNLSGSGSLEFTGTQTLNLLSDLTLSSTGVSLDFSSGTITVDGVGNLTIQTGAQLALTGDTIVSAVDLDNQGTLQVGAGTSTISSTSFTQAGDLVLLSSGAGAATLTVANGFTNDGVITLRRQLRPSHIIDCIVRNPGECCRKHDFYQ